MGTREAEIIANGIVRGFEKTANSMDRNSERNAQAIIRGFRETARSIGESLGGTKAELMMDCLLKKSEDGKILKPDSDEWNECRAISKRVLEEF